MVQRRFKSTQTQTLNNAVDLNRYRLTSTTSLSMTSHIARNLSVLVEYKWTVGFTKKGRTSGPPECFKAFQEWLWLRSCLFISLMTRLLQLSLIYWSWYFTDKCLCPLQFYEMCFCYSVFIQNSHNRFPFRDLV